MKAAAVLLCIQAGCATVCADGGRVDSARAARLSQLLTRDAEASQLFRAQHPQICFVPGLGTAVISNNTALLDGNFSDGENAARLGHLLIHSRDKLGDGCAVGLAAARSSEAAAVNLEQRLRRTYGVAELPARVDAERDYAQRCGTSISAR